MNRQGQPVDLYCGPHADLYGRSQQQPYAGVPPQPYAGLPPQPYAGVQPQPYAGAPQYYAGGAPQPYPVPGSPARQPSSNGGKQPLYQPVPTQEIQSPYVQQVQYQNTYQGVPLYDGCSNPALQQKFVVQGWKDVWAAVLFYLQFLTCCVWAFYNLGSNKITFNNNTNNNGSTTTIDPAFTDKLRVYMPIGAAASVGLAFLALALMRFHPRSYIVVANVLTILINIGFGVYLVLFNKDFIGLGVMFFFFATINALWLYCVRRRIPFAGYLLSNSVSTITRHYGTIVVSFFALLLSAGFYVLWYFMIFPVISDATKNQPPYYNMGCKTTSGGGWSCQQCADSTGTLPCTTTTGSGNNCYVNYNNNQLSCNATLTGSTYGLAILFLLMLYWTAQVIFNVVHVTASGTVATWYFAGAHNMPFNPSMASLKRAMTTSFGSICFGSLIIALLQVLHTLCRSMARNRQSFLSCIALCLVTLIERLMQYFNIYAMTHVAIYGSSFIEAAKQTWHLLRQCIIGALINDNLVFPVLTLTALLNSVALGVLEGIISRNIIIGILVGFICYIIHMVVLRVVYSGVVTIFVCFAECPDALSASNPELHAQINEAAQTAGTYRC